MKDTYTRVVCALALLLAMLATSCQNDREALIPRKNGRKLTLTASMPQDAGIRVGLEKDAGNKTLIARWKAGDKVTIIFEQSAQLTSPMEIPVANIGQEGKSAKLDIEVPESIDVDESYTIHAFCGVPGTGVRVLNKEILVDILPLRGNRLEDIVVPVVSKTAVAPEMRGEVSLRFDHLGSVEYVDLKNASDTELKVSNCHLYATEAGAEEWRYLPKDGKHHLYKPIKDEVVETDGSKPNPIEEEGTAVAIAPGATHTFVVWHRPTGKNIPEFGISVKTEGRVVTSKNKKIAKEFSMTAGKAYRVQAEWKKNTLRILGEGVEESISFMKLTTALEIGHEINLSIGADQADQADVWIDLNNNSEKDPGEEVTKFESGEKYTLLSRTITVYGKVTDFGCELQKITSLDVSNNTALKKLLCHENLLTSLDVSKNLALTDLNCVINDLTSLDVSKNVALKELSCYCNKLTSLDVSNNTVLEKLYCNENELASLDVSKNLALKELSFSYNQLTSLDVSKNVALVDLSCMGNELTSLDVSKNLALKVLWCGSNQLTTLDVSKNVALKELHCDNNQLSSLDVSKNLALKELHCFCNEFASLDVSGNKALLLLNCEDNKELSTLRISSSINNWLCCRDCKLSAETLDKIFDTLPDVTAQEGGQKKIYVKGNPGVDNCHLKIATDKGWKMDVEPPIVQSMTLTANITVGGKIALSIDAPDEDKPNVWIDLNNNNKKDPGEEVKTFDSSEEYTLGAQTITVYGKVTDFDCCSEKITSLDVSNNTALTVLDCNDNELTSLDVSGNVVLTALYCDNNDLNSLDVSKNVALTVLHCYENELTSLDVSKNVALTVLHCYDNELTSLDVSGNKALVYLNCEDNKELSSLKIGSSINDRLFCRDCNLSADVLNTIFRTLPDVKEEHDGAHQIFIQGNPGADTCDKTIATNKGWTVF